MGPCNGGGQRPGMIMRLTAGMVAALALSACITTYTDYPKVRPRAAMLPPSERTLTYSIDRFPMLMMGKSHALDDIFAKNGGFGEVTRVDPIDKDDPKPGGLFAQVNVKAKNPSVGAAVWTYIAGAGLLTLLPAFSTKDGYIVTYQLFIDGEAKKTYRYEITRKFGLWIVFLPFIWINLFTPSEEKAFSSTAYAFLKEAKADGLL